MNETGRQISHRRGLGSVCREEDGQTLVEMGFVLPTFFLMLFGVFQFMFILFGFCDANYVANLTARYASLHSATSPSPASVATIQAYAKSNLIVPGGATPTVIVNYSGPGGGSAGSNNVGQAVGIGILYSAAPGMAFRSYNVTAQAFRLIIH